MRCFCHQESCLLQPVQQQVEVKPARYMGASASEYSEQIHNQVVLQVLASALNFYAHPHHHPERYLSVQARATGHTRLTGNRSYHALKYCKEPRRFHPAEALRQRTK